jgi:hypothetical protein
MPPIRLVMRISSEADASYPLVAVTTLIPVKAGLLMRASLVIVPITTIANTPIALSPLISGISAINRISILRYGIRDTMRASAPNTIVIRLTLR